MGHRQEMNESQRINWDCDNYKKRLEANKGHNYEYWTEKHDKMLENGWDLFNFRNIDQCFQPYTTYEDYAKEKVIELRNTKNYARIICVTNRIRIRTYSIIYKIRNK